MRWSFDRYRLQFGFLARTSRAAMTYKDTYLLHATAADGRTATAECPLFAGLSAEDDPGYECRLDALCRALGADGLTDADMRGLLDAADSSARFGVESALDLLADAGRPPRTLVYDINGLVWMGDKETMAARIRSKLREGFRCIKLKIGGISFDDELDLLALIRRQFGPADLELRLDANGAFTAANVMERLERLAQFNVHSIEQPVRAGQHTLMARVCAESPIPVALDEELIGVTPQPVMEQMLGYIRPSYVILKPALCGGFGAADGWIAAARANGVGWWATSALESNIGLAAIARWLDRYTVTMPQGLGTGELFTNNIGAGVHRHGSRIIVHTAPDLTGQSEKSGKS